MTAHAMQGMRWQGGVGEGKENHFSTEPSPAHHETAFKHCCLIQNIHKGCGAQQQSERAGE